MFLKLKMKSAFLLICGMLFFINVSAQGVSWYSFEEAQELNKKEPKKLLVDVYTKWCGPCKMMMKQTFGNKWIADYINKTPGKEMDDVLRGIAYTDGEGTAYFKFPRFWKYLLRTKSWAEKTYPKGKTIRLMETLFGVEEITKKLAGKNNRVMAMKTIKLDKPNLRINERQKEPWE